MSSRTASPPPASCQNLSTVSVETWRIIDANANRALEALRTLEDHCRFSLKSTQLTGQLKHLRHQLAGGIGRFPQDSLLQARHSAADIGTQLTAAGEYERSTVSIITAAAKRGQQAIRCLEEQTKLIDVEIAADFEAARYQLYDLEVRVQDPGKRRQRLADTRICLLVDGHEHLNSLIQLVPDFCESGMGMVQLRAKSLNDREWLQAAKRIRDAVGEAALFIVNDRPDVALACEADGVHLGQEDLPIAMARRIVGPAMLVGISTHDPSQVDEAVTIGADYLGFGPVFKSRTKSFDRFVGPETTGSVASTCPIPMFAIGGINASNLASLTQYGADRIAVSSSVWQHASPEAAIKELFHELLDTDSSNL